MALRALTSPAAVESTPKRVKTADASKITTLVSRAQHKALKMYCAEEGISLQDLFLSAVAEKVKKKGLTL
jgi:hypothetical protein